MFSIDGTIRKLAEAILSAEVDQEPSENIYLEDLFDPDLYKEIIARLPDRGVYEILNHPEAKLPDGRYTRLMLDLTKETMGRLHDDNRIFWEKMHEVLTSNELKKTILEKFESRLIRQFGSQLPETVAIPIFYKDFPGYFISVHQDAPFKVATFQIYLPNDESQNHLGTSFYQRKGNEFIWLKRNQFKPNSGYAFVRTEHSWHGVDQIGENENERNSIAITIYIKDAEYKRTLGYEKM